MTGTFGCYTSDDGHSRPLDPAGDLRTVIATSLARREGWAEIRPAHWRTAGRVAKAITAAGWARTSTERQTARKDDRS